MKATSDPILVVGGGLGGLAPWAARTPAYREVVHTVNQPVLGRDFVIARAFGATKTPEAFLFNQGGKLVYHGAIDDSRNDTEVTRNYLRDALDAVLEGREPPVAEPQSQRELAPLTR